MSAGHATRASSAPRALSWLAKQLIDWLPALPLILLALALLIVPIVMVVAQSLRDDTGAWTLGVWAETLQRRGDQRAIVTSSRNSLLNCFELLPGAVHPPVAEVVIGRLPGRVVVGQRA